MTALVFTAPPYPIRALTSNYPGCDTPDIVLENGQRWAACNAGANEAYLTADQSLPFENSTANGGPDAADKAYMGAYYQWGRNTDVTIGAAVS